MTFCGDLPFVPSGIHHHLFENLRRKGHHCHGLTHLSWAERKIFYRVLGKKFCGLFIYPGQSVRQVVAVYAPGDRARQGWRDRSGRCKPGFLRQGWKPARAETAPLAPFTTARPARGTPGKGISRKTTKQTIIRAAVIRVRAGGKRE